MELWLWLWVYDYRWLIYPFASKLLYQLVWLIPLITNLIFVPVIVVYLNQPNVVCNQTFTSHIYARLVFTIIISVAIIIFMIHMSIVYKKEQKYYEKLKKIYTNLDLSNLPKNTWWTKNKILNGAIGVILLILSCINVIWSLYFKVFVIAYEDKCNVNIVQFLDIHTMISIIGNVPVAFLFITNFLIKAICIIMSITCPRAMVALSILADKACCRSKSVSNRLTFKKKEMIIE